MKFDLISQDWLDDRIRVCNPNKSIPEWISLCQHLLDLKYKVSIYEAKTTDSIYILVELEHSSVKIRYSNHLPKKLIYHKGKPIFYVGHNQGKVITYNRLLNKINKRLTKK